MLKNLKNKYKSIKLIHQKKFGKKIQILDVDKSIELLLSSHKSLCRFGDGELDIIIGKKIGYQEKNSLLRKRLKTILCDTSDICLKGIPDTINNFNNITKDSYNFWLNNMYFYRKIWLKFLSSNIIYLSANMTRLYIRYENKENCGIYFNKIKQLWNNRDLIIIEGRKTRFGIGNDLLNNATSITRVLCPAEDAFEKYSQILEYVINKLDKKKLILICLGPTATVLAYDLAINGFQAIDIGHLDIEYEWFLKGVDKKVKIEGKYTNETKDGNEVGNCDDFKYLEQILKII
ncbi:SP_1767 family glycosyltransferase [Clostridium tyrobutyricum]|uniref:SP_1767 family glycosyltransferase n=1 Tax=Clostridium tyrobutyricum TaxID=1519 RepID=UPI0018A94B3E|nr:SP_1767 family glycosyltransferase [Clostridium tyrobutyricum]